MKPKKKVYLGDGAFAEVTYEALVLTTEDGIKTTNVIYLEPEVLRLLLNYLGAKA